jgi:2-oxo-4-hydroxy-4-carboxy--5-ureidoimidazoline (OHCU) decarboxylase
MSTTPMPIEELDSLPAVDFREALSPLFEGAPGFLGRLALDRPYGSWWNLLERARVIAHAMPEPEKIELLNAHPRLGAPPETVSRLSFEEQGYGPADSAPAATRTDPASAASGSASPSPVGPAPLPGPLARRVAARPSEPPEAPRWGAASSAGAAPIRAAPASPAAPGTPPAPLGTEEGDSTRARLARLNAAYEDWFGFRYCVFVAGRSLEALVPELEKALTQSREHELHRGIDAVIDIGVARSGAAR